MTALVALPYNTGVLATDYRLVNQWGSFGADLGQFNEPADITVDHVSGDVYVSDLNNDRIQKFDSDGYYLSSWGISGNRPGQFQHPADLAVDPETQFVYVSDIDNSRIQKFDKNGNYISEWGSFGSGGGQFNHPGDVDVGSKEGIIFVTDVGNHRIQKFNKFGDYLMEWGSQGTGDGQFNRPAGIAYDSTEGVVYVLDTMNNRVQKFDSQGNFLAKWGLQGKGDGQLADPTGIALDSDADLVYITDNDNHRIQVFDKNGNFIYKWGSASNFERPTGIAYDPLQGYVYVNDKVRNNIQVFSVPSTADLNQFAVYSNERENENENDDQDDEEKKKKKVENCDSSYPDFCIESPPPDLDCNDISKKNFKVVGSDPHRFDADHDGIGCEGNRPPPPPPPGCDPSYPDFCIESPPPDLDCNDISKKNFKVVGSDPHRFDADHDGIGCEGNPPSPPTPTKCDPSYPDVCILSPPPDLDCSDVSKKNFKVVGSDPHRFDADHDGIGCESGTVSSLESSKIHIPF